jgi:hypothetical protein
MHNYAALGIWGVSLGMAKALGGLLACSIILWQLAVIL